MGISVLFSFLILALFWVIPLIMIAKSDRTHGGEKVAWILAVIFISWFAWVFYLLLAPLKQQSNAQHFSAWHITKRLSHSLRSLGRKRAAASPLSPHIRAPQLSVITGRRPSIKTCPYCIERLPFFNLIKQRLTLSEEKAIKCPNCKSTISSQGGASIWWSFGFGSTSGYLFGKLLSSTGLSYTTILASVFIGLFVFILSAYFTAPIRTS